MKNIIFNKIKFINVKFEELDKIIQSNSLLVFPSGPGLSTIDEEDEYYQALKKADYVFFDSGYLCLILRIIKNIYVSKLSGFLFLKKLIQNLKNSKFKILLVDPNSESSKKK